MLRIDIDVNYGIINAIIASDNIFADCAYAVYVLKNDIFV